MPWAILWVGGDRFKNLSPSAHQALTGTQALIKRS